ncbi:MAG: WYL domain-containing protein [Actinomycetota bacterium]
MSGPASAADRLQRLLVMLPWLMERGEVPLGEVAERFEMSTDAVVSELELVAMCGLPPYVDEMVDVFVDDGLVFVGVPRLFTRALRLTAPEGFSLLAAGRAAMELPGADVNGPLARGLQKLSVALADDAGPGGSGGGGADDTAGVAIDLERPPHADAITDAVPDGIELSIAYYSPATDETSTRSIVPRRVFVDGGHWYVDADDDRSGERRTFRIDRIESAEATGRIDEPEPTLDEPPSGEVSFFDDPALPRAVLRIGPSAAWILDQYPYDEVRDLSRPRRWREVRLPIASERWLARLVVRLGPDVKVIEPASLAEAAERLAREIVANY